jgi:hypothetical protein
VFRQAGPSDALLSVVDGAVESPSSSKELPAPLRSVLFVTVTEPLGAPLVEPFQEYVSS